jgi:hypothetical protein
MRFLRLSGERIATQSRSVPTCAEPDRAQGSIDPGPDFMIEIEAVAVVNS